MHMLSRKDLNLAELETVRVSRTPTTVFTVNGEVQTNEEATVKDTSSVLSFGKLCEEHGYSFEWASGQKPQLTKNGKLVQCNTENLVPIVVPGLSTGSSSTTASASPVSLPQDTSDDSSSPATTRRGGTSIPVLGNRLQDPT